MSVPGPVVPDYAGDVLGRVMPAAAGALGVNAHHAPDWGLPTVDRVCVVLVDGLGHDNLADPDTRAPFLKGALPGSRVLRAGFPTTTAVSMGSFGTGRPPGEHGLVGYDMLDPAQDRLLNGLRWAEGVDPVAWQPYPTVFGALDAAQVPSFRLGPDRFESSGLTEAALRGGSFVAATKLPDATRTAAELLHRHERALVYLYWGGVDYNGHTHGWRSRHWRDATAELDRLLADLRRTLPKGTLLLVTADHGMLDLGHQYRHDLARTPGLLTGVRHIAGETRCLQLHVEDGATRTVADAFAAEFGDQVWVRTRDEAVADGWFGPVVDERVRPRIGDVLVAAAMTDFGLVDSRVVDRKVLRLIGQHGSLTEPEQRVPFLTFLT
ncbi:alkaline phosphatase family protein [Nakamurella deserti]|uniref:alkaline phosphatase family protein n=1 Tax=Nakamurella deserti TaxID=2164074 RepID=UPI000DBE99A4|nr:alkaline phosphatase family protein [Nakamurella deserti]